MNEEKSSFKIKVMASMAKFDHKMYKLISKTIVRSVEKSKYTRHKYWILLEWKRLQIGFILMTVFLGQIIAPIMFDYDKPRIIGAMIIGVGWMFIAGMMIMTDMKETRLRAEKYDEIFEKRKNPEYYQAMKEICLFYLVDQFPGRLMMFYINLFVYTFLVGIWVMELISAGPFPVGDTFLMVVITVMTVIRIVESYVPAIFDFEPPTKKTKKKKASLTKLMEQAFQNLVRQLSPVGAVAQIVCEK